jgi:hypothetical protein
MGGMQESGTTCSNKLVAWAMEILKPTLGAGDAGGVDAIGGA